MRTCRTVGSLAAASFISITGQAAFADVTAQQVWDDWQTYMQDFGYTIEAQETDTGGGLTVSDIQMVFPIPEEGADVMISVAEMTLTDRGDGTVEISVPEVLPMVIKVGGDDAEEVEVTLDYTTQGFEMIVAGDAQNMTYTYSADLLGIVLGNIVAEGETLDIGTAKAEIADMQGVTEMRIGNLRTTAQTLSSGAFSYEMDFKDPEGTGGRMVMSGGSDSIEMQATTSIPADMDMTDMAAALQAGFAVEGGYEFGPGSMNINFNDAGSSFQGNSKSDGGTFSIAMDSDRLRYGATTGNVAMEFAGSDIPFPIALAMSAAGFDLTMPVSQSDDAQDFAVSFNLTDFTMSDMIWGIFDPAGQLPRDPATVAAAMSGKVRLLIDLLDPAQMESVEGGEVMPGELLSVTLSELLVRAAGAELTGSGDVEIDNDDMTSYDGMPKPVGTVNLRLVGANALLDKLVEMGFVSDDDAMGARMMMGLFAVPGDGDDTLTSEIQFTDEGQVLANGQRLK